MSAAPPRPCRSRGKKGQEGEQQITFAEQGAIGKGVSINAVLGCTQARPKHFKNGTRGATSALHEGPNGSMAGGMMGQLHRIGSAVMSKIQKGLRMMVSNQPGGYVKPHHRARISTNKFVTQ